MRRLVLPALWVTSIGFYSLEAGAQVTSSCDTGTRPGGSQELLYGFPTGEGGSNGSSGELTLGFRVQVPAGVVTPRVGLSYSSRGGESVLGRGWSLSAGASVVADLSRGTGPLELGPDSYRKIGTDGREYISGRWVASSGGKLVCEAPSGTSGASWADFLCYTEPRSAIQYRASGTDRERGFTARDPHSGVVQTFGNTAATQIKNSEGTPVGFLLSREESRWGNGVDFYYEGGTSEAKRLLRGIGFSGDKVLRLTYTPRTTNIRTTYELSVANRLEDLLTSIEILDDCAAQQGGSDTDLDGTDDSFSVSFSGACRTLEKYSFSYGTPETRATGHYVLTRISHDGYGDGDPARQVSFGTTELTYNGDGVRARGESGVTTELVREVDAADRYRLPSGVQLPTSSTTAGPFQTMMDWNGDGLTDLVTTKDPDTEAGETWPSFWSNREAGEKERYIYVQFGREDGGFESVAEAYLHPLARYAAWFNGDVVVGANPSGDALEWSEYLPGETESIAAAVSLQGWSEANIGIDVSELLYRSDGICLGGSCSEDITPQNPENAFRLEGLSTTLTCAADPTEGWGVVLTDSTESRHVEGDVCDKLFESFKDVWSLTLDDHDQIGWLGFDLRPGDNGYPMLVVSGNLVTWDTESGSAFRDWTSEGAIYVSRFDPNVGLHGDFLPFEKVVIPETSGDYRGLSNEFLSALSVEVVDDGVAGTSDLSKVTAVDAVGAAFDLGLSVASLFSTQDSDLYGLATRVYSVAMMGGKPETGSLVSHTMRTLKPLVERVWLGGVSQPSISSFAFIALEVGLQVATSAIQQRANRIMDDPGQTPALVGARARSAVVTLRFLGAVAPAVVTVGALLASAGAVTAVLGVAGAAVGIGMAIYAASLPSGEIDNDGEPVPYDIRSKRGIVYRMSAPSDHNSRRFVLSDWVDLDGDGRTDYVVSNYGKSHTTDTDGDGYSDAFEEWVDAHPEITGTLAEKLALYNAQTLDEAVTWTSKNAWLVAKGATEQGGSVQVAELAPWSFTSSVDAVPYLSATKTHHVYVPGRVTHTELTETMQGLMDMNGDGLADLVDTHTSASDGYSPRVYYNTRHSFAEPVDFLVEGGATSAPSLCGEPVRIGRQRGIDWSEFDTESTGYRVSGSAQVLGMMDMDGNGLPDLVLRDESGITPSASGDCGVHAESANCGYAYVAVTEPLGSGTGSCSTSNSGAWFSRFDGGTQDHCVQSSHSGCVKYEGQSKLTQAAEDLYFPQKKTPHYVAFNTGSGFTRFVRVSQDMAPLSGSLFVMSMTNAEVGSEPSGKLVSGTTNFVVRRPSAIGTDGSSRGGVSLASMDILDEDLLDPEGSHPVASEFQLGAENPDVLTSVTTSDGGTVTFSYALKVDTSGAQGPMAWVLSRSEFNDQVHGEFSGTLPFVEYSYADGFFDRERKEFLGFLARGERRYSGSDLVEVVTTSEREGVTRGMPVCVELHARAVYDGEVFAESISEKTLCSATAIAGPHGGEPSNATYASACAPSSALESAMGLRAPLQRVVQNAYTTSGTAYETLEDGSEEGFFRNIDVETVTVGQFNGSSQSTTLKTTTTYSPLPYKTPTAQTLSWVTASGETDVRREQWGWAHHDSDWVFLKTTVQSDISRGGAWQPEKSVVSTFESTSPYRLQNTKEVDGKTGEERTTSFSNYTASGLAQTRVEPSGLTVTLTYASDGENGPGRVKTVTRAGDLYAPTSTESYSYDPMGRVVAHTDRAGLVTTFAYDGLGFLCWDQRPGLAERTYGYYGTQEPRRDRDASTLTSAVEAARSEVSYVVDDTETVTSITYWDGFYRPFRTGSKVTGYRTVERDADGAGVEFAPSTATYSDDANVFGSHTLLLSDSRLNARGESVCASVPYWDGSAPVAWNSSLSDGMGRNVFSQTVSDVDGTGALVTYATSTFYSTASATETVATTVDDFGTTAATTRNPLDHVTSVNQAGLLSSTSMVDNAGLVLMTQNGAGAKTVFEYDGFGRVVKVCTQDDLTESETYNAYLEPTCPATWPTVKTRYDAAGLADEVTDPNGHVTTTTHSVTCGAPGTVTLPTVATDGSPSVKHSVYDGACRVTQFTSPTGSVTETTYGANGKVDCVTHGVGSAEASTQCWGYDLAGTIRYVENGRGYRTYSIAGFRGETLRTIAPSGATTSTVYDVYAHPVTTTDPMGQVVTRTWNLRGQVKTESTTKEICNVTSLDADVWGTTSATVTTENIYSAKGELLETVDASGARTCTHYDALSRVTRVSPPSLTTPSTCDGSVYTETTYDSAGNVETVRNALGVMTSHTYDAMNRLKTTSVPLTGTATAPTSFAVTSYHYDDNGNVVRVDSPLSVAPSSCVVTTNTAADPYSVETTYNAWNKPLTETRFASASGTTKPSVRYEYDAEGRVANAIDERGYTTSNHYDALSRLISITRPDGTVSELDYDENSNVVAETDGRGLVTTKEFDASDRLVETSPPAGSPTFVEYNLRGQPLCDLTLADATTGRYEGTAYTYSSDGALTQTAAITYTGAAPSCAAATNVTTSKSCFDNAGRLLGQADGEGNLQQLRYDARGRATEAFLPKIGSAAWEVQTTEYDDLNRPTRVLSPMGGTGPAYVATETSYDLAGRKISEAFTQAAFSKSFAYDAAGNLCQTSDVDPATGLTARYVSYQYDPRGLVTKRTQSSSGTPDTFVYDDAGLVTYATDASGSWTYAYDAVGRLESLTQTVARLTTGTNSFTTSYTYYENGALESVTYPTLGSSYASYTPGTLTVTLDPASNRLSSVATNRGTVANGFVYDGKHRTTSYTLGSGATVSKSYDSAGRLSVHEVTQGATLLLKKTFSYNLNNTLTNVTDNRDAALSMSFSWDERDRLTSATSKVFLSPFTVPASYLYQYNAQDLVSSVTAPTAAKDKVLTYDAARGTLSAMTVGATSASPLSYTFGVDSFGNRANRSGSATNSYSYDSLNRMKEYTYVSGSTTKTAPLTYSHDTRRVDDGSKVYLYGKDRMPLVELTLNSAGNGFSSATFNVFLGENLAQTHFVQPGTSTLNQIHHYVWNWQGSPEVSMRDLGSGSWSYERMLYGPWGDPIVANTGTSNLLASFSRTKVGFQDNYRDANSGFNLMGFRHYDPDTFAFTQPDPSGLAGGPTRFGFARANATKFTDRSGLEPETEESTLFDWAQAAYAEAWTAAEAKYAEARTAVETAWTTAETQALNLAHDAGEAVGNALADALSRKGPAASPADSLKAAAFDVGSGVVRAGEDTLRMVVDEHGGPVTSFALNLATAGGLNPHYVSERLWALGTEADPGNAQALRWAAFGGGYVAGNLGIGELGTAGLARAGSSAQGLVRPPRGLMVGSRWSLCGACFVEGTLVETAEGLEPIESIELGDRVVVAEETDCELPGGHNLRKIALEFPNPVGSGIFEVEMIRPTNWVDEMQIQSLGGMFLSFKEIGARGWASVISIEAAPSIKPGPGCPVITTMRHTADALVELHVEGVREAIRATVNHPFYLDGEGRWVEAGALKAGQHLRTRNVARRVIAVEQLERAETVINIEVHGAHQYLVSTGRLLSHNAKPDCLTTQPELVLPDDLREFRELTTQHFDAFYRNYGPWTYTPQIQVVAHGRDGNGFKIHVSAGDHVPDAVAVLELIQVELLGGYPVVSHKFPIAMADYRAMQLYRIQGELTQVGKFVTIYPRSPADAHAIGYRLDELFQDYGLPEPPRVPFDYQIGSSGYVFGRYGAFFRHVPDDTRLKPVRDGIVNIWDPAAAWDPSKPWKVAP